jgi:hypothetical protein
MSTKKAQMEILGLAIVVLLLILGMVFVVRFIALGDKGSIRKEVSESQIASNYIATYLDTTVEDCRKLTVEELLIDCAEGGASPTGGSIICQSVPEEVRSCRMAKDVASIIFSRTFDQWKAKYYFSSYVQSQNPFIELSFPNPPITKCAGQKRSKDYFLSTASGTLHVKLDLCG